MSVLLVLWRIWENAAWVCKSQVPISGLDWVAHLRESLTLQHCLPLGPAGREKERDQIPKVRISDRLPTPVEKLPTPTYSTCQMNKWWGKRPRVIRLTREMRRHSLLTRVLVEILLVTRNRYNWIVLNGTGSFEKVWQTLLYSNTKFPSLFPFFPADFVQVQGGNLLISEKQMFCQPHESLLV